jgi:exonuclease SbcD
MRILHFSDLHLGVENYGSLNPKTGLSTRVDDFLRSFDEVIDYAINQQVDTVLFSGDAFKNRDPNPTIQRLFARRVRRLAEAAIPTVLLIGNHDLPSISARATAIEIYDALGIPQIYVARKLERWEIPTRSGPLQVIALPWLSRSMLLNRDEIRALSSDELQRRIAEEISASLAELVQELDPALPAVLLGHLSLEGAKLGSEQSIMLGEDLVLGTGELSVRAFDYVALGHIHKHQRVTANPPTVYAGSIERVDFGEEDEEKGFVIVDIREDAAGNRAADWAFHPVKARPFLTLRITATGGDPLADVQRAIERRADAITGSIVRVIVSLPAEHEELLRTEDVRRLLQEHGAHFVAKVVRDVELQTRARVDIRDEEALDPLVMLERWLNLREMPEDQRRKVHDRGKALIQTDRAGE